MSRHPHLENQLTELAESVDWPEADVTTQVRNRIVAPTDESRKVRFGWKVAVAAACVMAAIMVVPAGRQAVADLLSVAGIEITFVGSDPPTGSNPIDLGEPTTLEGAASHVDFPLALPTLETNEGPDKVYLETGPPAVVHLTWDAEPDRPAIPGTDIGLLLTQFTSPAEGTVFTKDLASDTEVERTSVGGLEALWLEGAPHELTYQTTGGTITQQISRFAENVLLWEDDGVTYRLESGLEMVEAQRIAEALTTYVP